MRAVVQRVSEAKVTVNEKTTGEIKKGLLVLLGIHQEDTEEQLHWMVKKVINLRIFQDEEDKMNLSVLDIKGGILVVSQFTLYGDAKKGMRPSFIEAARPEKAEAFYEKFVAELRSQSGLTIETGIFGAMMDVSLINQGPVTIVLEK